MALLDSKAVRADYLFPSLLLQYFWPGSEILNANLRDLILTKERVDKGISTTNVGGWHSKKNLQEWEGPHVQTILSRIRMLGAEMLRSTIDDGGSKLSSDWKVEAWANVNRIGNRNKYHNHVRNLNLWSGIYYVSCGVENLKQVNLARTVFVDQHQAAPLSDEGLRARYFVDPLPGLMLLFPSSLGHRVEAHFGRSERITIAFNLKNDGFSTIHYEIEKSKVVS